MFRLGALRDFLLDPPERKPVTPAFVSYPGEHSIRGQIGPDEFRAERDADRLNELHRGELDCEDER